MPAVRMPGMSSISLPPSMVGAGQWEMPMPLSASRGYSSGRVSRPWASQMSLPVKPMRRHHSRERTPKRRTMLLFSPSQRWVCMWTPALRARRMVSVKVSSVQLMGWQGASTICRMEKGAGAW